MKSILFCLIILGSVCISAYAQEETPQITQTRPPHKNGLKLQFCSDSAGRYHDDNCFILAISNDSLNQYKIIGYLFAITKKNDSIGYLEAVNGSKITFRSRERMAKMVNGDRIIFTQVIVKDLNGKMYEIDGIDKVVQ